MIASHEVSPLIRLVSRGDTTVVDAYLSPLLARYVRAFRAGLGERHAGVRLEFMQSNGGLAAPEAFRACNAVLSGPAGGLVATGRIAEASGRPRLIAFDMGGTSTDVALYDGALPQRFETGIAGVRLQAPMMNIHTVAAGGGSMLAYAGGRLTVGPGSAGSEPGPACYRNGGPLTVTDVQVLLGRIRADTFPAIFGAGGDEPLDVAVVRRAFEALASSMGSLAPEGIERLAAGFLDVAVESMARAIRHVSVREGHDPAEFALLCYGGAAPQHACRVADALGIREILIHPLAGVLSAYGIGLADRRLVRRQSLERALTPGLHATLDAAFEAIAGPLRASMAEQGAAPRDIRLRRTLELRAPGTETALEIAHAPFADVLREFRDVFTRRFGFAPPDSGPQVATLAVEAVVAGEREARVAVAARARARARTAASKPGSTAGARCRSSSAPRLPRARRSLARRSSSNPTPRRSSSPAGRQRACPAACSAWSGTRRGMRPRSMPEAPIPRSSSFSTTGSCRWRNRWAPCCRRPPSRSTSASGSISPARCLTRPGALIANAPHMPVHLGSMGASVRAVIAANAGEFRPGRAWMLNAPYAGGTHLPDITVVSPVFAGGEPGARLLRRLARAPRRHRRHHAGLDAAGLAHDRRRKGCVFDNFLLVDGGAIREAALRDRLAGGPWPARNPDQNVADLKAQLAANARGAAELAALDRRVRAATRSVSYMRHVQDNAEACVREVIGRLGDGRMRYEMDDGSADRGRGSRSTEQSAERRRRFRGHVAAAAGQFQRAARGLHRRRALRVPHAGRRRHPAERGLPAPDRDPRPARARC